MNNIADNNSVADWVEYIQGLHFREIDMSLDRVRKVFDELCPDGVCFKVVSIAGTNGKGSTAELTSSIFSESGLRVGKFSSPHLVNFNERFTLLGEDVADNDLLEGFKIVEQARGQTPITYFEYCLLLAVALFQKHKVDVAIMEVGLGGRLDAVNVLDADIAVITSISLDHTAWLGETVEEISLEKAGISRANRPCLLGLSDPYPELIDFLQNREVAFEQVNSQFRADFCESKGGWSYRSERLELKDLPLPFSQDGVQLTNAALAIRVVELSETFAPVSESDIRMGLSKARINGRCQLLRRNPWVVLDVAHNESSVDRLAKFVSKLPDKGKTMAVCGMLRDKEVEASLAHISSLIDKWHLCSIEGARGSRSEEIADILVEKGIASAQSVSQYGDAISAYTRAVDLLNEDDCLVVFGSFFVVGDIIRHLNQSSEMAKKDLS